MPWLQSVPLPFPFSLETERVLGTRFGNFIANLSPSWEKKVSACLTLLWSVKEDVRFELHVEMAK